MSIVLLTLFLFFYLVTCFYRRRDNSSWSILSCYVALDIHHASRHRIAPTRWMSIDGCVLRKCRPCTKLRFWDFVMQINGSVRWGLPFKLPQARPSLASNRASAMLLIALLLHQVTKPNRCLLAQMNWTVKYSYFAVLNLPILWIEGTIRKVIL